MEVKLCGHATLASEPGGLVKLTVQVDHVRLRGQAVLMSRVEQLH